MFVCAFVCDSMLDASWLCVCASCAFMTVSVVKNLMWGEPSVLWSHETRLALGTEPRKKAQRRTYDPGVNRSWRGISLRPVQEYCLWLSQMCVCLHCVHVCGSYSPSWFCVWGMGVVGVWFSVQQYFLCRDVLLDVRVCVVWVCTPVDEYVLPCLCALCVCCVVWACLCCCSCVNVSVLMRFLCFSFHDMMVWMWFCECVRLSVCVIVHVDDVCGTIVAECVEVGVVWGVGGEWWVVMSVVLVVVLCVF